MTPTLETERLLLRPFRHEDAAAIAALAGNWKVARMLSRVPYPYTREMAEEWLASLARPGEGGEEHIFCIEYDGELAGSIGLLRHSDGVYEMGYWIGEPWWGRGFATESARRIIRFALDDLGVERLVSGQFTDNPASGRVLEKCGFRYTGDSAQHSAARGGKVAHRDFEFDPAWLASVAVTI